MVLLKKDYCPTQMVDIRQSPQYAKYLTSQGWIVERIDNINYFLKKFPLVGSILKIQRPEKIDFEVIDKLYRKYGVFQTVIEPNLGSNSVSTFDNHNLLLHPGFKLSKNPFLSTKTLKIDLTQTLEKITAKFTKDCRYALRKGEGIKIKKYSTPKELKTFREAWKKSVKFNRYVPSLESLINLRKSFPQNNSLFLASHNISGNIIGGVIFTRNLHERSNYITYYWQGFTNNEGRALLSQYSLLYQGILWAKKHKSTIFDFEGIYDERFPNKSWLGFTHFKRSFGGHEVFYPGCYTRFRWP